MSAHLGFAAICFSCHGHCSHGEGGVGHCNLHLTLGSSSPISLQVTNGFQGEDSLRVLFFPGPVGCVFDERTLMRAGHFLTPDSALLCAAEVNSKLLAEVELKKVSDVTEQRGEEKTSCSADCYDAHDLVLAFLKGGLV